jgi:hypothetical protein
MRKLLGGKRPTVRNQGTTCSQEGNKTAIGIQEETKTSEDHPTIKEETIPRCKEKTAESSSSEEEKVQQ